jgi:hypothetical protein
VKRTHLAAILASLALALPSCGGDDEKGDSAPAAAGTSPAAEAEQPREPAAPPEDANPAADPKNGNGGSSAADAKRAANQGPKQKENAAAAPQGGSSDKSPKPAAKKPRTPEEHLAALSPAERRKLERDLYRQGKELCYAYGPKLLAKEYKLPSTDPETVARLYARAYEAAAPSLALPYQQGCLAGFRRYERNPPAAP